MKSSRFAVAVVGLALVGLWYTAGGTAVPGARAAGPEVAPPVAHANLSVYLLRGPDLVPDAKLMTLQEALATGRAVVHETSNVNVLAVENLSADTELFVQSGDIVKGGKQDRVAATDVLLPPKSGAVPLPAHCVEQGRWTNRGEEDVNKFKASDKTIAGRELKYANASGRQSEVWASVKKAQDKLNDNLKAPVNAAASPTSFQLTLEAPAVLAKVAEYEAALRAAGEGPSNVVGAVFVVNGQITGAEVYGSNALFRKAWPKLLNSAAVEAVAELTERPTPPAPGVQEVERFLALGALPGAAPAGHPTGAGLPEVQALGEAVPARGNRHEVFLERPATARARVDGETRVREDALDQRAVRWNEALGNAERSPGPGAQPAGPGNRVNSTRCENEASLMVESRDAGRGNAVLRRSYIKK